MEAEGFSSTGGEEGKDITIGEGIVDDFFLEWAKKVVTKRLLERAKEIVGGHEIGMKEDAGSGILIGGMRDGG